MRIFLILTLLISIQSFGQNPTNYQYRTVRERLLAMMADSTFHLPRYNGVPSGVRTGSSTHSGALGADTLNNRIYFWSDYVWHRLANISDSSVAYNPSFVTNLRLKKIIDSLNATGGFAIPTLDQVVTANPFTNNNIEFDTNNGIVFDAAGTPGYLTGGFTTGGLGVSSDGTNYGYLNFNSLSAQRTYTFPNYGGTVAVHPTIVGQAGKVLAVNGGETALEWITGGGGTPGGSDKQVQYNNAGAFGGSAGFETALTNLRTKITAQATTEVPLEIKAASSQTANLLNISSSAGTGDLAFINASGEMIFGGNTDAGVYDLQINDGLWVNNVSSSAGNGLVLSPSTTISSAFVIQNNSGGEWIMAALNATSLKMFTSSSPIYISPGGTDKAVFLSGGGMTMPEGSAPGTPASAMAVIYPKSDGLWYGKDDAGVESRLSNQIFSKGMTLESPGAAESFGMWQTQVAITVSSIKAVVIGSSPSVTINIAFGTDRTSGTNVFSSGTAITNTTTGQTINSGFNDATIPAGSFIWFISTAQSGTVTQIEVTINYTED